MQTDHPSRLIDECMNGVIREAGVKGTFARESRLRRGKVLGDAA